MIRTFRERFETLISAQVERENALEQELKTQYSRKLDLQNRRQSKAMQKRGYTTSKRTCKRARVHTVPVCVALLDGTVREFVSIKDAASAMHMSRGTFTDLMYCKAGAFRLLRYGIKNITRMPKKSK